MVKGLKNIFYKIVRRVLFSKFFGNFVLNEYLFKHLPSNINTYVDIGAYNGEFFDVVSKKMHIENAILIEAQQSLYNELCRKYSSLNNTKVLNAFLSDKKEKRPFYINSLRATSSTFEFDKEMMQSQLNIDCVKKIEIETFTLDSILDASIPKIDFMKIDVQGAELLVLKGAEDVLKKTNFLFLEVSLKHIYIGIPTFEDIQKWLNEKGFILLELSPAYKNKNNELLQVDCLFKKQTTI